MAFYSESRYEAELKALNEGFAVLRQANILQRQKQARQLSAADSPPYVRKTHFPRPPEDQVLSFLLEAVDGLKQSHERYTIPPLVDVCAEWVYDKAGAAKASRCEGPTLLYIHGGGFLYGSPATARRATRRLADLTRGRCLAIQYRYCTEQPFPGSLLDAFVAFLSLLAPSKDMSTEEPGPVPASQIILAGESSGLNLVMALVQVLLFLRNNGRDTIRFHRQDVKIELPAAVTGISGFFDITCSLPSWTRNSRWDCLPELQATYTAEFKDQEVWPADPPRADVYCEKSAMAHPLVSTVAARDWVGAPPMFLACGEERNADCNFFIAKYAHEQGVPVRFQFYEKMTHVWPTALPKLPHSAHVLESWASYCRDIYAGMSVESRNFIISFNSLNSTPLHLASHMRLSRHEVLRLMREGQKKRLVVARAGRQTRL